MWCKYRCWALLCTETCFAVRSCHGIFRMSSLRNMGNKKFRMCQEDKSCFNGKIQGFDMAIWWYLAQFKDVQNMGSWHLMECGQCETLVDESPQAKISIHLGMEMVSSSQGPCRTQAAALQLKLCFCRLIGLIFTIRKHQQFSDFLL